MEELIYTQCFGKLYCDSRFDGVNAYRVVIDGLYDGSFTACNDDEAILIFKDGRYASEREKESRWRVANILYNMSLDMDYADYSEYYYSEIDLLADEIGLMSEATRECLARVADNNRKYFDLFVPEHDLLSS